MGQLLLHVGVIVICARIVGALCERIGIPALVGEIAVGILLGPSLMNFVHVGEHGVLAFFAELGAVFLLFGVGTETDVQEMLRVGMAATRVAVVGVILPMLMGFGVAELAGYSWAVGLFLGGALSATSVGITARVFGDRRALGSSEARVVLGAAVIDDVLGLIILAVVVPIASGGSITGLEILTISAKALAFVVLGGAFCVVAVPRVIDWIDARIHSPHTSLMLGIGGALCGAASAHAVGLAPIVGAMLVGLGVAGSKDRVAIARDLEGISSLFVPVFFAVIGIRVDLSAFASTKVLTLTAGLCFVAVIGKVVAGAVAGTGNDRLIVGWGMVPRGEVGLIFASVGLAKGVLSADLAAAVVAMVLVTTIGAPPILTRRLARLGFGSAAPSGSADPAAAPVRWDTTRTRALLAELRTGDAHSLELLQSTGSLAQVLPEIDRFLALRQREHATLRASASHFPTVERMDRASSEDALLAAVYVDVADYVDDRAAAGVLHRLATADGAERAIAEAFDARQIAELASTPYGSNERRIHALADHIRTGDRLETAVALAYALGSEEAWYQSSVIAVRDAIAEELGAPGTATRPSESKRAEAMHLAQRAEVRERLEHAPAHLFAAADPATLARRLELLDPPPTNGRFRVEVTPTDGLYEIDIVTRDRPKLLARITAELVALDLEMCAVHGATWGDGLVYDRFTTRAATEPDPAQLRTCLEQAVLRRKLRAIPLPELDLAVSNVAHPFFSVVNAEAAPSRSLVPAVVNALARAGMTIHAIEANTNAENSGERTHITLDVTTTRGSRVSESDVRSAFQS